MPAPLLLASGSTSVVREILGHSTIALTANTYAAVLPSLQREAAERLATFIGFGRPPARGPDLGAPPRGWQ
jgi:hypothetical protein